MPPATRRLPEAQVIPSLLELDRFSKASLQSWKRLSADLDQLTDTLHFGTEPQRLKYREQILTALQSMAAPSVSFKRWIRMVSYRYSLAPLSAAGSMLSYGGRFNVGRDVDKARRPWPALYIAATTETAYREYYQLPQGEGSCGLSPEELNLECGRSTTTVMLDGNIEKVFDVGNTVALEPLCRVLKKIKMPRDVAPISKRLGIPRSAIGMITSAHTMQKAVLHQNWRVGPIQYGLPSPSQVLAELIRDAGYEAIKYPSTKTSEVCLAVFPENLGSKQTFVALSDTGPEGIEHMRLDLDTADNLCGWELLRNEDRPYFDDSSK